MIISGSFREAKKSQNIFSVNVLFQCDEAKTPDTIYQESYGILGVSQTQNACIYLRSGIKLQYSKWLSIVLELNQLREDRTPLKRTNSFLKHFCFQQNCTDYIKNLAMRRYFTILHHQCLGWVLSYQLCTSIKKKKTFSALIF